MTNLWQTTFLHPPIKLENINSRALKKDKKKWIPRSPTKRKRKKLWGTATFSILKYYKEEINKPINSGEK